MCFLEDIRQGSWLCFTQWACLPSPEHGSFRGSGPRPTTKPDLSALLEGLRTGLGRQGSDIRAVLLVRVGKVGAAAVACLQADRRLGEPSPEGVKAVLLQTSKRDVTPHVQLSQTLSSSNFYSLIPGKALNKQHRLPRETVSCYLAFTTEFHPFFSLPVNHSVNYIQNYYKIGFVVMILSNCRPMYLF